MKFSQELPINEFSEKSETRCVLEPAHLKRLIFMSYMFAQGEQDIQLNIFRWLKSYYGAQPSEVTAEAHHMFVESQFKHSSVSKVEEQGVHAPGHISEHRLADDYEFISYLENDIEETPDFECMQSDMYAIDLQYLKRPGGRPNRKPDGKENTLTDPYFSFVVQYLVRQESTGDQAMDALCKYLAENVSAVDKQVAESLIAVYNQKHPNTPLSLQELSRIYMHTKVEPEEYNIAA